jgi:hypothetical protein
MALDNLKHLPMTFHHLEHIPMLIWRNDKGGNKRVLIWHFTLVLIKMNYGQIGDKTGLFYTTNPVFYTSDQE